MLQSVDLQAFVISIVLRMGGALLVLVTGRWLARRARAWISQLVARTHLTNYLEELAIRVAYYGILTATILIALAMVGVPVNALVGSVGIILVILGIALQESISNLAATVIFFVFQPFGVGDYIETAGTEGTVAEIQVFNTVLHKGNGQVVVLPNGRIQENGVINYSRQPVLRVDVKVGVSYDADLATVRETAVELMRADTRVLAEPAPDVIVDELGASSVQIVLRAFVKGEDYWQVSGALKERVHAVFPAAGIELPYPQLDVHMAEMEPQTTGAAS